MRLARLERLADHAAACVDLHELDERLRTEQRGLHDAASLLAMATEVGHRQLGWSDAGRIEVGARADLTTIALDSVRTSGTPPELAVEAAVFAATASDVTSVYVDGRQVVADGHHLHWQYIGHVRSAFWDSRRSGCRHRSGCWRHGHLRAHQ